MAIQAARTGECRCIPMTGPVQSEFSGPPTALKKDQKYFHEVGAEMAGNQLIIRMEKDKNKKSSRNWEPPCDCDVIEIKRPKHPSDKPKITNGGDNNQILFRIHSKSHINKKEDPNYKPQAIAYQINKPGTDPNDHCKKITVYPQFGGPVSQEVYSDHISNRTEDVYLLRVKKKSEEANNRSMEVELRTPKVKKPKEQLPPPPKDLETKVRTPAKRTLESCVENIAAKNAAAVNKQNGEDDIKSKRKCKPKESKRKNTRSQEIDKLSNQNCRRCCANN